MTVSTTVNLYLKDRRNVGDLSCAPFLYFDFGDTRTFDLKSMRLVELADLADSFKMIVVGGGGLFLDIWVAKVMRAIFSAKKIYGAKTVIWGIGVNDHNAREAAPPSWLSEVDYVGIRDYELGHRWVPCASCMSPGFDKEREKKHPLVIYDHFEFPVPVKVDGIPRINNSTYKTIDPVLDFLGSAETVFTSTYHGVYWATLLGCKCVMWPFSAKFRYFKHKPPVGDGDDVSALTKAARAFPKALAECRDANQRFYDGIRSRHI